MMVGDLLRGVLEVVPLPVPAPPRPAGIVRPAEPPPSAAAAAFVAALEAHVSEISARGFGSPAAPRRRRA
jgi:LysR family pca operon transcriptional activator